MTDLKHIIIVHKQQCEIEHGAYYKDALAQQGYVRACWKCAGGGE